MCKNEVDEFMGENDVGNSENEDYENEPNENPVTVIKNICPVCYNASINAAIMPCGHTFCIDCNNSVVDHTVLNHCPECRGQVVSIIYLFGLD